MSNKLDLKKLPLRAIVALAIGASLASPAWADCSEQEQLQVGTHCLTGREGGTAGGGSSQPMTTQEVINQSISAVQQAGAAPPSAPPPVSSQPYGPATPTAEQQSDMELGLDTAGFRQNSILPGRTNDPNSDVGTIEHNYSNGTFDIREGSGIWVGNGPLSNEPGGYHGPGGPGDNSGGGNGGAAGHSGDRRATNRNSSGSSPAPKAGLTINPTKVIQRGPIVVSTQSRTPTQPPKFSLANAAVSHPAANSTVISSKPATPVSLPTTISTVSHSR